MASASVTKTEPTGQSTLSPSNKAQIHVVSVDSHSRQCNTF